MERVIKRAYQRGVRDGLAAVAASCRELGGFDVNDPDALLTDTHGFLARE